MPKVTKKKSQNGLKGSKSTGKGPATKQKLYSSFLPIPLTIPIPTSIPSSSSKPLTEVTQYIYVRPNISKTSSKSLIGDDDENALPAGRTVFVANLPVDMTERALRVLFGKWGVVESVSMTGKAEGDILEQAVLGMELEDEDESEEDVETEEAVDNGEDRPEPTFQGDGVKLPRRLRPRRKAALPASVPEISPLPPLDPRADPYGQSGLRCAHIVYLDALPVQRLMSHSGSIPLSLGWSSTDATKVSRSTQEIENPTGLQYYLAQYSSLRPSLGAVKSFADSSMARFDHLHSLLLKSRAKKSGAGALVDEDGFTVVVRGGRYGRTGGRGPGQAGVAVAKSGFGKSGTEEENKKRKKGAGGAGELEDFYKFQKVDRKRQELAGLRAKFEHDKAKVEDLKKAKRFKPY